MNLTDNQKDFILENFFKDDYYAGWKNIANSLLDKGECVVAGDKCIWSGGVGNFITTVHVDGYFGCIMYKFDLLEFLSSEWFKEIHNLYMIALSEKKRNIDLEYDELLNLKSTPNKI